MAGNSLIREVLPTPYTQRYCICVGKIWKYKNYFVYLSMKTTMLKQRDFKLSKTISIHIGEESMWYIIPTFGFQRINWEGITDEKEITHLFVVKWLKGSAGIIKRYI